MHRRQYTTSAPAQHPGQDKMAAYFTSVTSLLPQSARGQLGSPPGIQDLKAVPLHVVGLARVVVLGSFSP